MEQLRITKLTGEGAAFVSIRLSREEYRAVKGFVEQHRQEFTVAGGSPEDFPLNPNKLIPIGIPCIGAVAPTGVFPLDILSALVSLISVGDAVTLLTASLSLAAAVCNLVGALHNKKGEKTPVQVEFTRDGETYKIAGDSAEEVAKLLEKLPAEQKKPKLPLF